MAHLLGRAASFGVAFGLPAGSSAWATLGHGPSSQSSCKLDREGEVYKSIYKQRSATERINSQAVALGIERPHLRNQHAIANRNTLIYLLINLRFLQRLRRRQSEMP